MSAEEEQVVRVEVDVKAEDDTPNGVHLTATENEAAAGGETAPAAIQSEERPSAEGQDAAGEDSGTEEVVEANGIYLRFFRPREAALVQGRC